jgi:type IV pilus assembly protein PilY1
LIKYTGGDEDAGFDYALKDYFFDGPTGQLTVYTDDGALETAYIYPTMRRGGRMIYALDVTDPDAEPTLLWRKGCANLDNDDVCDAGFDAIGQTWSMPISGFAAGYQDLTDPDNPKSKPVVLFGGGFDDCLNEDAATYPATCSSAKGKGVYILDAETGVKLKYLETDAPVISELSGIDIDFDGNLDFAYAADVAGNLYRISLSTLSDVNPAAVGAITALSSDQWSIAKIGYTAGANRRFYNAPTAAAFKGVVFVTVGSGDRERPLDSNYPYRENVQNRFYALIDQPYTEEEPEAVNLDGDTMFEVVEQQEEVIEVGLGEAVDEEESLEDYSGWFMDLPDRGEQVANPSAIAGGKVFFNTFQPGGASTGLCTQPLGIGKGFTVDLFDPQPTTGNVIAGGGIPIPPIIATVKVPPGLPPCDGLDCPEPEDDPCASGECEIITVCIGCEGFEPVLVEPIAPPIRSRMYWIEDMDRSR